MLIKSTPKKLVFIFTLLGILGGLTPLTLAQLTNSVDKNVSTSNQNSDKDELQNFFNPLDIMHRANLERSRDGQEFADDTRNSINKAAEEFKRLQQQRLQQAGSNSSNQPIPKN
ncbi:hypothetical protein [Aphanothece sacrum]|uniref:Uncharacterized protein n=1 Tax=Aphanothece sacrum FPU1 TaxID=1920663 RepID=A0A401ILW0_APHSA|nr:hypothetical protein [Aphanothece sacrum]GBF82254.1 hypothetical protein AsFPU1_3682 [Aphanothece sacrum FPU1]GBF87208.1 hypothetical protein AsFPU3_4290 [Aphanothece sacrum FPU3]